MRAYMYYIIYIHMYIHKYIYIYRYKRREKTIAIKNKFLLYANELKTRE